jgi:predicted TIM-barrel fold metal-dependent hydrolase
LRGLAALPHASIKISGFAMFERPLTPEAIKPYVRDAIDIFGTERAMFASNFPVDRAWTTWDEVFGAFDTLTTDFSEVERAALFATNAERIYRI